MPAAIHDVSVGGRVDRSVQVGDRIEIYVQPNKNAENITLRKLANKDSHQNLAEAWVDTKDPLDNSTVDKVFDILVEDAKEKGHS